MRVIDSHTEGEPTRVILDGGPPLGGGPLAGRLARFAREFDHVVPLSFDLKVSAAEFAAAEAAIEPELLEAIRFAAQPSVFSAANSNNPSPPARTSSII